MWLAWLKGFVGVMAEKAVREPGFKKESGTGASRLRDMNPNQRQFRIVGSQEFAGSSTRLLSLRRPVEPSRVSWPKRASVVEVSGAGVAGIGDAGIGASAVGVSGLPMGHSGADRLERIGWSELA